VPDSLFSFSLWTKNGSHNKHANGRNRDSRDSADDRGNGFAASLPHRHRPHVDLEREFAICEDSQASVRPPIVASCMAGTARTPRESGHNAATPVFERCKALKTKQIEE
jgi:hypothetical protein